MISAKYYELDGSEWFPIITQMTDLLLIDSAVANEAALDRGFLTQAVYPWLKHIDGKTDPLNSALPF